MKGKCLYSDRAAWRVCSRANLKIAEPVRSRKFGQRNKSECLLIVCPDPVRTHNKSSFWRCISHKSELSRCRSSMHASWASCQRYANALCTWPASTQQSRNVHIQRHARQGMARGLRKHSLSMWPRPMGAFKERRRVTAHARGPAGMRESSMWASSKN
eukprot:365714-Chlamydomonas_euryale.AAC.8